jgi:D-3-phosphoglycerate dehydrogenase
LLSYEIVRLLRAIDTVDLEAATEKGICVANVPDYCKDEVSDHALALMLGWTRKVVSANQYVKSGIWDFNVTKPIYRLRGGTLGLVGFGIIPQSLTDKVKPLGLRVIAYDPYVSEQTAREKGVQLVSLDELCKQSDIVSVHAPLMKSTKGMMGTEQFRLMKKHAILINTSRGPVVDENALVEALSSGLIAGAALDVLEKEPIPPDHPLLCMDNVILTPHIAWYSEESAAEMRFKAAMGVADVLLHGQYPKYLLNKEVKNKVTLKENQPEYRYDKN